MTSQNRRTAGRMFAVTTALVLALAPAVAEARAGKGSSSGSRGERSEAAPPSTATAPGAAQSFQRSAGPNQAAPAPAVNRPGAAAQQSGGMFSSPLARGLMGGLIGAGLIGLLMGSGLLSGLGSLAGIFGLLIQLALIGGLVWLAVAFWRRRQQQQPAAAAAGLDRTATGPVPTPATPYSPYNPSEAQPQTAPRSALGGMGGGMGGGLGAGMGGGLGGRGLGALGGGSSAYGAASQPLKVDGADFERFEKLLEEVQGAYAREDLGYLRRIATEEMAGYFREDLEEQERKGLQSKAGNVKLLQGDLSEAWVEQNGEFATVAMRYEMVDAIVDRATGRLVEGDLTKPQEITEIWTFIRGHGGSAQDWILSAIQQIEAPTQH